MPRRIFYTVVFSVAAIILIGSLSLRQLLMGLPDIRTLESYAPALSTKVFDSKGEEIADFSIEKRALLPLSRIPVDLQNAAISVEDDQFMNHWGISPKGIIRSAIVNFIHRRVVQGASTITQQLAKQIFLKPERKFTRKIREVLLAVQIERNFSKQEILEFYLNQIYFGEGAYGVQSAARIYFGKDVGSLNLAECAMLAGLIRAPRGYSPFAHPEQARKRRAVVLQRMIEDGKITAMERDLANAQPVPTTRPIGSATQAPYFVEHVRHRMEQKYGYNALWRGGLKIYTTIDMDAQKQAEAVMEKSLSDFDVKASAAWAQKVRDNPEGIGPDGVEISTIPPAKIQGAFVLLDVKTGAVRAMIGGRESMFNRAVQAHRQPGSTFKPFVWSAALQAGMTAASLVEDSPLAYYYDGRDWRLLEGATDQYSINMATQPFADNPDFKIWVPNNFDMKFLGTITLRKALALSRNICSINLINKIGPPLVVEMAHRLGIRSWLDPVPSLGLGSSVVSPLEMANAFETFANGGIYVTPYSVTRVEDHDGRLLESHVPSEHEAISPQLAYIMTNLLKGVVQNGTAQYAKRLGRNVAGKTGTTNDNKDLWFIGFTPDYVAGAWMGYDDFMSLGRKDWTGGSTVVPWWTEIMAEVLKGQPKDDFPVPNGIVFADIDAATGLLAGPDCPPKNIIREAFIEGTQPRAICNVDHFRPLTPQLAALVSAGPSPEQPQGAVDYSTSLPRPSLGPPPLPTDEELDQKANDTNEPADGGEPVVQ